MSTSRVASAAIWLGLSLLACGATSRRGSGEDPPTPPDASGGAAGSDNGGGGATSPTDCALPPPALTRLTFGEVIESARALFGDALAEEMAAEVDDTTPTTFPPLASTQEGTIFTDSTFRSSDGLAQIAGRYVREHFELTDCATDDFQCVKDYVHDLAERAFRRPMDEEERLTVLRPVEQAEALGVSTAFGVEYGVYAVLQSPHFLYRRAFGILGPESGTEELALDSHEVASAVSYFLTGGPPDAALLESADAGRLYSVEELAPHVDRLLAAPSGRRHVERLVAALWGLSRLDAVVIDPAVAPLTPKLREGMRTELESLLASELWSGAVGNLLTSRRSRIDAGLAELYGVAFPPAGKKPDASGFVDVELPDTRAGLLTRAGWSTMTSRPDRTSVVGRGLQVMSLLCEPAPPFPELPAEMQTPPELATFTEQELAQYRKGTAPCDSCHQTIDPPGLALEDLDVVGRFRTVDDKGRPIDASATLPAFAGGSRVTGALELSHALPEDALARCMSQAFLGYAIGNLDRPPTACELDAMAEERAESGDQSFTNILRQIALSRSFRLRR